MRAIVFAEPGRWSLEEVPDPDVGPTRRARPGRGGRALRHGSARARRRVRPDRLPDHPGSRDVRGGRGGRRRRSASSCAGDRVSVDPTLTCGSCAFCTVGRSNLCENWNGSGVARTNGSTAELQVAPVRNVHRLADGVDLALAALIEPLSCAIRGYDLLPRRMGEHYLIYGAGTMGLMMAQLAPRAGAASVTVVDRNPARLDVAKEVGVAAAGACRPTRSARRGGWDVVIDCTGVVAAIEDGLTRVRRGGTFQQFGVAAADATAGVLPVPRLQRRAHHHRLDGGAELLRSRRRDVHRRRLERRGHGEPRVLPGRTTARRWRCSGPAPGGNCRSGPKHDESMELL